MDQYRVYGNPIAQSKSPQIHQQFANQTGESLNYEKQLVPVNGFADAAKAFFAEGGCGLNITVPFKLEAFQFATRLTERARNAGAVNTLKALDNGDILGDNTDGQGMVSDIVNHLGWSLKDKTVLLLGAGGAVRGVLQPLLEQEPTKVVIANRTVAKALTLVREFKRYGKVQACGFADLAGQQFDVVINGTSASLSGDLPPLPEHLLSEQAVCYDMMYGAEPTVFMQWASAHGATSVADGLGMLVGQAAEAFYLWRRVKPEVAPVIQSLRAQLIHS
ncbi:shikimate dehydrogenase [Aestuariicella hydrocarbonica]|uniref:Shikimate dehydrogenase (NADP(+)) n=1 Tax=Pseudomaricurvus hydrocarbonicus TaxID=1470433 RepID=A0A9E5MP77_9GAMM|nr:shikimate dehydrogenase [Aestuariicella hydrocarbonica]NHO67944.1 shikimate dehydrogenase [Aestuariicella hydrocarbonica]